MSVKRWLLVVGACSGLLACGGGRASPPQPSGTQEPEPDPQQPELASEDPTPDPQAPQIGGEEPSPNDQDPLPTGSAQPGAAGGAAPGMR